MSNAIRSQVTASVVVSTVQVREGRATWWETAVIVGGKVSDGVRSTRKADALVVHDSACDCVRGYDTDKFSKSVALWRNALAEVTECSR